MKITLTQQEICEKFGFPVGTEVVISYDGNDGWISNVGHDFYGFPDSISYDAKVEVEFRDGSIDIGIAYALGNLWKETDGRLCDIVAYRIVK